MGDPGSFRDATQIVLPATALADVRADLEAEFTVTITEDDGIARIIGSPVVIKDVGDFLARHGVSLP
ncbi:VNG_1110C family protein [Halocalculus aciditolerans]|uniref:Uncharacterized protein n=1 Tax=Halocalculus aciditolerans TaxID=1383812 RepID=A0A830FAU1_9EURY|nr:hypothetical protein [Halocalculus aciditolerans]GGL56681.1 hypothetical protein GCM10009039_13540 [Halocalculus aciditolerans]